MKNPLKARLTNGERVIGTFVGLGHPDVTEWLSRLGFDWLLLDAEHAPLGFETLQRMMQSMNGTGCVPLVRPQWNDFVIIKRVLDLGACGVLIPWVNSREEAENAVKYCLYPQSGGLRGTGPRKASDYGFNREYFDIIDEELLIAVQIETEEALKNLEDIFSVDRIDVAYIGPYDLSMSLGVFRQFDHPKFLKALETVLDKAEAAGVTPGIYCSIDDINHYIEKGFRFNSLASDVDLLLHGAISAMRRIRGWKPLDSSPAAHLFK